MQQLNIMIFLFFSILIILNIIEMRNLIIPAKKLKIETFVILVTSLIILTLTLWYGKDWNHYLVGILSIIEIYLMWIKRGITQKGFNSTLGLSRFNDWHKIDHVEIFPSENKYLKVSFLNAYSRKDSYYFKKEDYDKIINILSENLPKKKLRVKQV